MSLLSQTGMLEIGPDDISFSPEIWSRRKISFSIGYPFKYKVLSIIADNFSKEAICFSKETGGSTGIDRPEGDHKKPPHPIGSVFLREAKHQFVSLSRAQLDHGSCV